MKYLCILSFLLALAAVNGETYSTENDDFDIDTAVADLDTLKSMVACVLDTVICSDVLADFKKDIPEAVQTACVKCTQAQKHIFHIFLQALKNKLPKEYEAFNKKYDSEGKYFVALEAAVASS